MNIHSFKRKQKKLGASMNESSLSYPVASANHVFFLLFATRNISIAAHSWMHHKCVAAWSIFWHCMGTMGTIGTFFLCCAIFTSFLFLLLDIMLFVRGRDVKFDAWEWKVQCAFLSSIHQKNGNIYGLWRSI